MRIQQEFSFEQTIRKSRFITCIAPVRTETEARAFIEEIRHRYPDCSHVCTAYSIQSGTIQRSSDNGEPAGTAGVPMLEAVRKSGIEDICCCVVRYFGGIKLGAGGLIRAYSSSAAQAIALSPKVIDVPVQVLEIHYPYSMQGTLETWLRKNGTIEEILYGEDIQVLYKTELADAQAKIKDITHGEVIPSFLRQDVLEKAI